jgi:hypothetical protein
MWGGGGFRYHQGDKYPHDFGCSAPGGFTKTTFNILEKESKLTIVVGGGGTTCDVGGYGGGGAGANGGSAGGGGSFIFSGDIAMPFGKITYPWGYFQARQLKFLNNEPTTAVVALQGAAGVIAVVGVGGGAGWFNAANGDIDQNGGPGGGIEGGQSQSSRAGRTLTSGGTQTAGGVALSMNRSSVISPNYMTNAGYLKGSGHTDNFSSGGSGGGGGGWFGGGGYQGSAGENAGGGGGSSFAGFVDNSTNSPLVANVRNWEGSSMNSYEDSKTRKNGLRCYKNTSIYRKDDLVGPITTQQTPPGNLDPYYEAGIGTSGPRGSLGPGGNGRVVLIF